MPFTLICMDQHFDDRRGLLLIDENTWRSSGWKRKLGKFRLNSLRTLLIAQIIIRRNSYSKVIMASLALEILNIKLDIFQNSFFKKLCCVFNLVF